MLFLSFSDHRSSLEHLSMLASIFQDVVLKDKNTKASNFSISRRSKNKEPLWAQENNLNLTYKLNKKNISISKVKKGSSTCFRGQRESQKLSFTIRQKLSYCQYSNQRINKLSNRKSYRD